MDLYNNNINDIKILNQFLKLKKLNINGINNNIKLKDIEDIISNLIELKLNNNTLDSLVECDINKITRLNIGLCNLEKLPDMSKFKKITTLSIIDNPKISNFLNISKIDSIENLVLNGDDLRGRMIDFSNFINLKKLSMDGNYLRTEDLENLKVLKNKKNMEIKLLHNSIIDATPLLVLDPSTLLDLRGNVNLTEESKEKLVARFGKNVRF